MAKKQATGEMKATREVTTLSMSEKRLGVLLLLVFLIVVEIGSMAMLGYRLENPSTALMIEDR